MNESLSNLVPRPTKVDLRDPLGRVKKTYWIEPVTLEALVWAAREFETTEGAEDGLSVLENRFKEIAEGRLNGPSMDAVLRMSYRLILKKGFFDRNYKAFKKQHWNKFASISAFVNGLAQAFTRASVDQPEEGGNGSKKKTA